MEKEYKYIFHESRWKKGFNIFLHFMILYFFLTFELYKKLVLLIVLLFIIYFLIEEIIEFIQHKPIIKISENEIWINSYRTIAKEELSEVKLDFRLGYKLPWVYFSLNFYQKDSKTPIYELPINTIENTKKLRKVLNASVE